MITIELVKLEESGLDLEAYLAEVINTKNGFENIIENAKKFKEKEGKKKWKTTKEIQEKD